MLTTPRKQEDLEYFWLLSKRGGAGEKEGRSTADRVRTHSDLGESAKPRADRAQHSKDESKRALGRQDQ